MIKFNKGFMKNSSFSLPAYSLYSLIRTFVAYVANSNIPLTPKPGFKPLTDTIKGAYVNGTNTICAAAVQNSDFYLSLTYAFLLIVGGIIINQP